MARKNILLEQLWRLLTLNLGTKLVSIAMAIVLWGIVLGSRNVEITKEVPLEVITSSDVAPASELPERISFRLSGPKAFLRGVLDRGEEPIRVNLVGTKPALVTYRFFTDNIRVPIGVKVLSIQPPSITVKLENLKTKQIPVHLQILGTPPEGYRLEKVDVKPNTIQISGPESRLAGLSEIQSRPIDISHLKETLEEEFPLDLSGRNLKVEGELPHVVIQVEPKTARYRIKNVEIRILSEFKSTVEEVSLTVMVKATKAAMESLDPRLIYGVVDLKNKSTGRYKVPVRLNLPTGISLVKVIPEQVHVTLY